MTRNNLDSCPFCESKDLSLASVFTKRPQEKTKFASLKKTSTENCWNAGGCGHFLSSHDIDLANLYEEDYVSSTYGNEQGIFKAYTQGHGITIESIRTIPFELTA